MRIEAQTIEELLEKSGDHRELMEKLDQIIINSAPELKRTLFSGPSITMIGYGEMSWKKSSSNGIWPLISLAPQKNSVNLYIAADKRGIPLPQYYKEYFTKSAIGKNCIRIKNIKTLNIPLIEELVRDTLLWADLKNYKYGRNYVTSSEKH